MPLTLIPEPLTTLFVWNHKSLTFASAIRNPVTMYKCKCIKRFDDLKVKFDENYFYDFEYVPTIAMYPPSYRVYHDLSCFRSFTLNEFKQYFQKY